MAIDEKQFMNVTARHPIWEKMNPKWDFYMDSYLGGEEYVKPISSVGLNLVDLCYDNSYLFPHELEIKNNDFARDKFRTRHQRSVYENLCAAPVNDLTKYFIAGVEPIKRKYEGDDTEEDINYTPYIEDIDLKGTNITAFMNELSRMIAVMGIGYPIVDKKPLPLEIATLQDQKKAGLRAYATQIDPRNLVNWSLDGNGWFNWALILTETYDDYDFRVDREITEIYILWTKDAIYRLDAKGVLIDYSNNDLGYVPILRVNFLDMDMNGQPESFLAKIAPLNRELYNMYSLYQEECYKLAFAQLQGKSASSYETDDEASAKKALELSTAGFLEYSEDPFTFLRFPTDALVEKRANIAELRESIRSISTLGSLDGTEPQQNKSGFAIWISNTGAYFTVAAYSAKMEAVERQIWDLIYAYDSGLVDGKIEVDYPREYQQGATDKNYDEHKILDEMLIGSKTAQKLNALEIVEKKLQPVPDDMKKIEEELTIYYEDQEAINAAGKSAVNDLEKQVENEESEVANE